MKIIAVVKHGLEWFAKIRGASHMTWGRDRTAATTFASYETAHQVLTHRQETAASSWTADAYLTIQ